MEDKELAQAVQVYMDYIVTDYSKMVNRWNSDNIQDDIEKFRKAMRTSEGKQYIKIIKGGSVHSFIVKVDNEGSRFKKGDILKAASWNSPAKNFSRGNVFVEEFSNISWTGAM